MTSKNTLGPETYAWWAWLHNPDIGAARAARANLRRCGSVTDALAQPATHDLYAKLLASGYDLRARPEALGALAMVLAHVATSSFALAKRMGQGDPPPVSAARFEQVIRARDHAELAVVLRRIMPLVDHSCDVRSLARDIFYWNDKTRQSWCFQYYGADPFAAAEQDKDAQDV